MAFKKPVNSREGAPRNTWQGNLSSTPIQEQRVPGLSYGRACSRKQLGRISSHEEFLMYGKKKRAKQNKQRQQKGIISTNSFFFFFNALAKPQEEKCYGINICSFGTWQSPWKALRPVCVLMCPRAVFVLPLLRRPREGPRKRPVPGRAGWTLLTPGGVLGVTLTQLCLTWRNNTQRGRANAHRTNMQNCLALLV